MSTALLLMIYVPITFLPGDTYEHYSFPLHCLSIQGSNKTEDCLYVCTSYNDANPYINRLKIVSNNDNTQKKAVFRNKMRSWFNIIHTWWSYLRF